MKKLVLFAAVAVLALASCGNKCENAADSTAIDSTIVADTIVADSIVADSIVADSAAAVVAE